MRSYEYSHCSINYFKKRFFYSKVQRMINNLEKEYMHY